MKIIEPSVEIISCDTTINTLKAIERAGRVCYKSEDKITEDSCKKFVENVLKRGHEAVIEHTSFIFEMNPTTMWQLRDTICDMEEQGFVSFLRFTKEDRSLVSGNTRAWRDFLKFYFDDYGAIPKYMREFVCNNPTLFPEFSDGVSYEDTNKDPLFKSLKAIDLNTKLERLVHQDITVKFICDRGVTHEIVRHRIASYCQESTRYCNYGNDKFGNEITVINPCYLNKHSAHYGTWEIACREAEKGYFELLDNGSTPQEARAVLPNSLKTEIIMTANPRELRHFLTLRTSKGAHPQMRQVATMELHLLQQAVPELFDDIISYDDMEGIE